MSDLIPCWRCRDLYPASIEPCVHGHQLCGGCKETCTECLEEA